MWRPRWSASGRGALFPQWLGADDRGRAELKDSSRNLGRDNRDPYAYDLVKVGMQYRPVSRDDFETSAASATRKPFLSKAAIEHGTNYDTTQFGHGNMGHTFGDRLSATSAAP